MSLISSEFYQTWVVYICHPNLQFFPIFVFIGFPLESRVLKCPTQGWVVHMLKPQEISNTGGLQHVPRMAGALNPKLLKNRSPGDGPKVALHLQSLVTRWNLEVGPWEDGSWDVQCDIFHPFSIHFACMPGKEQSHVLEGDQTQGEAILVDDWAPRCMWWLISQQRQSATFNHI